MFAVYIWMNVDVYCPHLQNSQFQFTALIRAAQSGHAHCVQLLLDVGVDKDAKNYVHFAPIFVCVCMPSSSHTGLRVCIYIEERSVAATRGNTYRAKTQR